MRAGLVKDPKEYRWCGYAEAVAGNETARQGLASFHRPAGWAEVSRQYREVLLVTSGTAGRSGKVVLDPEASSEVSFRARAITRGPPEGLRRDGRHELRQPGGVKP